MAEYGLQNKKSVKKCICYKPGLQIIKFEESCNKQN